MGQYKHVCLFHFFALNYSFVGVDINFFSMNNRPNQKKVCMELPVCFDTCKFMILQTVCGGLQWLIQKNESDAAPC